MAVGFCEGEEILTEISAKFTAQQVVDDLPAADFGLRAAWTDEVGDFQVSLAGPSPSDQSGRSTGRAGKDGA